MSTLVTSIDRCPRPASHSEQPEVGLAREWIRGAAPFCITLSLLSGCRAANPEKRVDRASDAGISMLNSLAERIAVAEATLSEKEVLAREAEREARFSECRAEVAEAAAEFALSRAQCLEQLASEAQCRAEVEREKGDGTLAGCGLGILVAIFTGGSAAPWALGGCFTGRMLADRQARRCGTSDCPQRLPEQQRALMSAKGWSELPQCGGRLGLEVETPLITVPVGVRVAAPGLLGSAGIRAGDGIVFMGGRLLFSQETYDGLARTYAGQVVEFRYVRDEQLYEGRAMLPENPRSGQPRVAPAGSLSYRWGVRVTWMAPWIAGVSGLERAAVLTVDGHVLTSRDDLRELLRYRRAGETLTLQIQSEGSNERREIRLNLGERNDPVAL